MKEENLVGKFVSPIIAKSGATIELTRGTGKGDSTSYLWIGNEKYFMDISSKKDLQTLRRMCTEALKSYRGKK